MSDPQLFPHGEPPAAAQPAIGQVWNAPDGRRLRVVGTGARIGLRNVETNRLTYMALRHFRPTEKWHLTIEPEAVAPAAAQPRVCIDCRHPWHEGSCPVVIGPGETSAAADVMTCSCVRHEYQAVAPAAALSPTLPTKVEYIPGGLALPDGVWASVYRLAAELGIDASKVRPLAETAYHAGFTDCARTEVEAESAALSPSEEPKQ